MEDKLLKKLSDLIFAEVLENLFLLLQGNPEVDFSEE